MTLPQPSALSYPTLDLYDSGDTLIRSDYVLPPNDNSKRVRNLQPMQSAGARIQGSKGDGLFVLDEITAKVLIILGAGVSRAEAEHQYEQDALNTVKLKIGNYSQVIDNYKGINSVSALAQLNKTYYNIEWVYIPKVYYWIDDTSGVANGTASQSSYTVTAGTATFAAGDVGKVIKWSTGEEAQIITFTDATHVDVDRPRTVASGNITMYDAISRVL